MSTLASIDSGASPRLRQSMVRNRLLAGMTEGAFAGLAPALRTVPLTLRQTLLAPREPIGHAWFVEDGLVSLVADTEGARVEIGMTGYEGFAGVPLVLGADRTPHLAIVQVEGTALRIDASVLRAALAGSAALREVLGRYVHSLFVQIGQTVHANAELTLEGRLARWILMTHDRLRQDDMPVTHEFLAMMLGVRRPGVTNAIHGLESAGPIKASRGRIVILDRDRLRELAGDSYGPAEAEYERLFARS